MFQGTFLNVIKKFIKTFEIFIKVNKPMKERISRHLNENKLMLFFNKKNYLYTPDFI